MPLVIVLQRNMRLIKLATEAPRTDPGVSMMMGIDGRRNGSLKRARGSLTVKSTNGLQRVNHHPEANKAVATKEIQAEKMR